MNNIFITLLFILVLCTTTSCRKEGDYFRNPNEAVNTLNVNSVQTFENIWSTINSGYAFWDITEVDWDQRYEEYKPKFEELDERFDREYESGNYTLQEWKCDLQILYDGLVSGLKDGHMVVEAGIATDTDTLRTFSKPSNQYNKSRMHNDRYAAAFRSEFLQGYLAEHKNVTEFDSCHFDIPGADDEGHASCVYTLSDGRKVPYLWNRNFIDSATVNKFILTTQDPAEAANARKWQPIYDRFINNLINTPQNELAGVILDLRSDGGGMLNTLPNYINIFAGEEHTYWETRYKEGMGRYDMSAWVPFRIGMPGRYRDCAAENIPIVVLCDVNSVSCAEVATGSIKQMPTAHIIGERTWGGHGPLSGQTNAQFNITYGGVSGNLDMSTGFFVYTSNYANRPVGGPVLEGIGISPDEEILYKDAGYQGQFEAAIRYLESIK